MVRGFQGLLSCSAQVSRVEALPEIWIHWLNHQPASAVGAGFICTPTHQEILRNQFVLTIPSVDIIRVGCQLLASVANCFPPSIAADFRGKPKSEHT